MDVKLPRVIIMLVFLATGLENQRLRLLAQLRKRCWRYDWVLDFDIKAFFDEIDHELLMRVVRKHTDKQMAAAVYRAVDRGSGAGRRWHTLQPWKRFSAGFGDQSAISESVFALRF
jgi:hypothetical protein